MRWAAAATVALAAALTSGGCGEKKSETAQRPVYEVPPALDRNLNSTEMDSVLAIKVAYGVVRDEYWEGHGGVIASPAIEVWYPTGRLNLLQGAGVLKQMEVARRKTEELFGRAPESHLVVVCSGNLEVFRAATGRDWWNYSLIKGDTLNLQSPMDLFTRGLFLIAAPREYFEWAIGDLSGHRAPRWVEEGLASFLSHEAPILEDQTNEFGEAGLLMPQKDIERELRAEKDRIPARRAHYNSYRMIEKLVQTRGQPAVLAFVLACGEEKDLDAASKRAFGVGLDALVEEARTWSGAGTP
jgi:hypothetical protein